MSQKKTSGGSLSHGSGARATTSGTSSRQDGARSPKQRPSQPSAEPPLPSSIRVVWLAFRRAMPKSATLTLPCRSTIIFWGLGYFAVSFTLGIAAKNAGMTAFQPAQQRRSDPLR